MHMDPIWFTLKDGRKAVLRSPLEEDAEQMLDYLMITSKETDFLLRYPEECGLTVEEEKAFLNNILLSDNEGMFVCVVDGRIAGNCSIRFKTAMKTRHRVNVGIGLISEFWNLGIGTRMFQEMTCLAREREGVLQMELEFIEGNTRARALYEKMGFRITGLRPNAIRLKDGTLLNEYMMVKEID